MIIKEDIKNSETKMNKLTINVKWSLTVSSSLEIDLNSNSQDVICKTTSHNQKQNCTIVSKQLVKQIIDGVKQGKNHQILSKFLLDQSRISSDLKQITCIGNILLGGGGCGSKSYRQINEGVVVKKEINQARQRKKRNDQSIIKADVQKLNEDMEALLNTKDDDIYNGKTYIIDSIFPIIDKYGVVANRVLHKNLSKLLQKAMNLLLRVNAQANAKDAKDKGQTGEKKDEEEIELEDNTDEDLVWTEKDKADMDVILTNIIDRIKGRIGQEPLLNQVFCITMVRNIFRTHKHSLKLIDEAIRYGVPLFGLIRNQDPTLILMLAVKGLQLADQQFTKDLVQQMISFQIKALEQVKSLPNEIKNESKNVQLLFAYFNALDDFIAKKNSASWEVQYFCLMQINELIKIMIDSQEIIQTDKGQHWINFFKNEEKGMFSLCQRKFSMSGIFIADAIDSLLLNHKFLRSISLDVIINSYKLIKVSDSKFQQNNPNTAIKSEIATVLYQRWLFENNNQVRTQFMDEDVLTCVDELVQKKKDGTDPSRRGRQGQQHQQSNNPTLTTIDDEEDKKLVEYAKQEQQALIQIQKTIKEKGQSNSELDKEINSMNETFECIKSDDGIKKIIKARQTELWKQSILNRRAKGEVQKDDQLLETINLYVNQRLQEKHVLDKEDEIEDSQKPKEFDALSFIKNEFIKKKSDQSQHPPLLTIVANGGMGKSMLLKKIEMELLEDFSQEQDKIVYERIPIIVKMADLDTENPNLIEHLDSQPIFKEMRLDAEVLKNSPMKKLILFDAFDEYKGQPFNLWNTLHLGEWQNTKIIVTSREENLAKEDYNQYFSVVTQGDKKKNSKAQSFLLYKLIKFGKEQLQEFARKSFEQEKKSEANQPKVDLLAQFIRIIEENQQVCRLISLPINAFIFIKTLPSLLSQNENISIRDQTELQELFFNYQFERESLQLPKAGTDAVLRDLYKQQFFALFQKVAIYMFKQGTLNADIFEIQLDILPQLKKKTSAKEQKSLLQFFQEYRNPQIITLADQDGRDLDLIKFIHKSLYEYFVARAMKFDFDQVQQNNQKVADLSYEEVSNFAINSKYIMDKGSSDISILQQFARMIKPTVQSIEFQQKCETEDSIQGHHNFIQIILLTRRQHHGEKLDIASSNMISAIAYNKPTLNGLKLTRCSFKKAYLFNYRGNFDITGSNVREGMLAQCFVDYSRSKTEKAQTQDAQSFWSSKGVYSFNACLIPSNQKNPNKLTVLTGSLGGYLNEFALETNGEYTKDENDFYVLSSKKQYEIKRSKRLYQGVIQDIAQFENKFIVVQQNNIIVVDENGEETYLFQAHKAKIVRIDINHSLKHLATFDKTKCIKVWNMAKQFQLISSIEDAHEQDITMITYSQTQNILVTSSKDKTCKVWKMEGNEYVHKHSILLQDPIEQALFNHDGKQLLVVQSFMKGIKFFNVDDSKSEEGEQLKIILPFSTKILFSPDGKYLIALCSNSVSVLDVSKKYEKTHTLRFNNYQSSVQNICFSNNSKYLVSAGYDNSCAVWDVSQDFKLVSAIAGHQDSILNISYSPDGKYFISTSQHYFYIWQASKNADGSLNYEILSINSIGNAYVRQFAFTNNNSNPDTYKFAISTKANHYILYEFKPATNSVTLVKSFEAENKEEMPISLQYSPDDKFLLSATAKELILYNVESNYDILKRFESSGDKLITCGCFFSDLSRDYHLIIIGFSNNTFELWDISEKSSIEKYKTINSSSPLRKVVCSPSGKQLATAGKDNSIQIWDISKDFALLTSISDTKEEIYKIAFSTDSQYLACTSADKSIRIWSAASNFESSQQISQLDQNTFENSCISFHPQNSKILLSSVEGILTVWDLEKAYEVDTNIQGHNDTIGATAFSHDGHYLVTACRNFYMKLWYCSNPLDNKQVPNYELVSTIRLNSPKKFTINRIQFMQNNKHFISSCDDGTTRIWIIDQMNIISHFTIPSEGQPATQDVALYPVANTYIATACLEKGCKIFIQQDNNNNPFSNIQLYKNISTSAIRSVSFSSDRNYLAAGSNNGEAYVFDSKENGNAKASFNLLYTFKDNDSPLYIDNLRFSLNCKYLIVGYFSRECYVYDIENRFLVQILPKLSESISNMDISADGQTLVISCYNTQFYLYKYNHSIKDDKIKQEIFQFVKKVSDHSNKIFSARFCSANNLLATGSFDQTCKIWQLKNQNNTIQISNIQTI